MASGMTTTTTAANSMEENFRANFEQALLKKGGLFALEANGTRVFNEIPPPADKDGKVRWNLSIGENSSVELFDEGDAAPTVGRQESAVAAVGDIYAWAWSKITGRIRDRVRNGAGKAGFDPIEHELMGANLDLLNLMHESFIGSTYGLEAIIDSGGTYAGISQALAYWKAYEAAVGGAQTLATLGALMSHGDVDEHDGEIGAILMPSAQVTNYGLLPGASSSVPIVVSSDGGRLDLGHNPTAYSYGGAPIFKIKGMTSTVILGLDIRPTHTAPGNWVYWMSRALSLSDPQLVNDDHVREHSVGMGMAAMMPKRNAKQTGVTA